MGGQWRCGNLQQIKFESLPVQVSRESRGQTITTGEYGMQRQVCNIIFLPLLSLYSFIHLVLHPLLWVAKMFHVSSPFSYSLYPVVSYRSSPVSQIIDPCSSWSPSSGRFFRCCTGHLENVFHNKAMKLLP